MHLLAQAQPQTLIPTLDPRTLAGTHPVTVAFTLLATCAFMLLIASVYKATHRGLSYSQSFQFSLILLGMLGSTIMMVASTGVLPALGLVGGFSLIRFRTAVKDPKDMAYILFVLAIGLAMGARLYYLGAIATGLVCTVIVVLTRLNFGLTSNHESIIRLTCVSHNGDAVGAERYEYVLEELAASSHLLSAVSHGSRMELTYGIRPGRGTTHLSILEALRRQPSVEHAELFDAKHQVEF